MNSALGPSLRQPSQKSRRTPLPTRLPALLRLRNTAMPLRVAATCTLSLPQSTLPRTLAQRTTRLIWSRAALSLPRLRQGSGSGAQRRRRITRPRAAVHSRHRLDPRLLACRTTSFRSCCAVSLQFCGSPASPRPWRSAARASCSIRATGLPFLQNCSRLCSRFVRLHCFSIARIPSSDGSLLVLQKTL